MVATEDEPLVQQPLDLLRLYRDVTPAGDEAELLVAHAEKVRRGNRLPEYDTTRTVVLGR